MTLWENVLAHYGWQGAALAAVLVVLLCVQLWYYLFAYGRIPGYKNSRRRQVLDAEPPLSVIVPMFSEDALFVEERLPLMLAQEYSDFEVVIVYVGRDNDFFEDLLRIRQSFPRVTATKIEQDARFPISTKMALNVGIKSAHYEHLIVTSTDVRPLSDRWLALMAKGFLRGDVVVGYCGLERRRGLADRWMRTDRMMESVQWLARAVAHRPYRGIRYNFGFTKRLYFDVNNIVQVAILFFEFVGVIVIILSGLKGFYNYVRRVPDMKITLAQGLAVGLEFKLCSEILKTVIVRDWKEIVTVAGIIGLRAALTFLIHWEIKEEKNHS